MTRFKWPVPEDEYFYRHLTEGESSTVQYRIERYKFLWEEFGPPADMLLWGGIPSMFALDELKRSYAYGNFMATVLLAQVFIEQTIWGSYALSTQDESTKNTFSNLIDTAYKDGLITSELSETLHRLRKMRNPYTHHIGGIGKRSYMRRLVETEFISPEDLVVKDAKFAVQSVVDYLRHNSPDWNPDKYKWSEEQDV
ncbi:MAG: hypothetical protein AB1306_08260 [Nitrospirota bacterium]